MCVRLDLCGHQHIVTATSKHGAFGSERGRLKLEGGRSATVCPLCTFSVAIRAH